MMAVRISWVGSASAPEALAVVAVPEDIAIVRKPIAQVRQISGVIEPQASASANAVVSNGDAEVGLSRCRGAYPHNVAQAGKKAADRKVADQPLIDLRAGKPYVKELASEGTVPEINRVNCASSAENFPKEISCAPQSRFSCWKPLLF